MDTHITANTITIQAECCLCQYPGTDFSVIVESCADQPQSQLYYQEKRTVPEAFGLLMNSVCHVSGRAAAAVFQPFLQSEISRILTTVIVVFSTISFIKLIEVLNLQKHHLLVSHKS